MPAAAEVAAGAPLGDFAYVGEDQIDADLFCVICAQPWLDPLELPCEHVFCRGCLQRHLAASDACPVCKQRGVLVTHCRQPSRILRNKVDALLVTCPFARQGCAWQGPRGQLPHHAAAAHACPNRHLGCAWGGPRPEEHRPRCAFAPTVENLGALVVGLRDEVGQLRKQLGGAQDEVRALRQTVAAQKQQLQLAQQQHPQPPQLQQAEHELQQLRLETLEQKAQLELEQGRYERLSEKLGECRHRLHMEREVVDMLSKKLSEYVQREEQVADLLRRTVSAFREAVMPAIRHAVEGFYVRALRLAPDPRDDGDGSASDGDAGEDSEPAPALSASVKSGTACSARSGAGGGDGVPAEVRRLIERRVLPRVWLTLDALAQDLRRVAERKREQPSMLEI